MATDVQNDGALTLPADIDENLCFDDSPTFPEQHHRVSKASHTRERPEILRTTFKPVQAAKVSGRPVLAGAGAHSVEDVPKRKKSSQNIALSILRVCLSVMIIAATAALLVQSFVGRQQSFATVPMKLQGGARTYKHITAILDSLPTNSAVSDVLAKVQAAEQSTSDEVTSRLGTHRPAVLFQRACINVSHSPTLSDRNACAAAIDDFAKALRVYNKAVCAHQEDVEAADEAVWQTLQTLEEVRRTREAMDRKQLRDVGLSSVKADEERVKALVLVHKDLDCQLNKHNHAAQWIDSALQGLHQLAARTATTSELTEDVLRLVAPHLYTVEEMAALGEGVSSI